ncbi:MAG TPA: SHOCT domain-containing protein [Pseudogracilibacillus sp.]|uniref:SHOCT domain-containing protein n=1 Tax=Paracerasibacillus soli TaxID=480284 RepID=A0ABU5CLX1_9BACI|nr:SHOCT domain-containing protein [Virgibacillus soli]MDY0407361.1 SHOCT domain-containing protein [Virgibacillus soli]HDM8995498.1 hypothetical protein [Listeria innocua]HDM8995839.1 hypothetical protein [Listeria innocua]HLR42642.1 SHOCT domain-containing protein [Pseudogracilibacillus sp.]
MRMTRLSPNDQTLSNKPTKPTEKQLQNELNFLLAEEMLTKLLERELISPEEFNQISKLNRKKFNPLLGPLMSDKP